MDQHDQLITFAVASALGVFFLTLAVRVRVSAIVILLLGGILVGPEFLGLIDPDHLGSGLGTIISLAVGLILFEGGLTLDLKGYRQVSKEIWGVLTTGVLITWLATTLVIKLIFDFEWVFCFLPASLIIVTGPTVIGPLLQRIRVRKNLHHILHWEGVLIDPIGVFIALLCYDYFFSTISLEAHSTTAILIEFFARFAWGAFLGLVFGQALSYILKREWVQKEYINIFVLAFAMLNFAMADMLVLESGLLSVTIAGLVVGYHKPPNLERIVRYKVELKDFLIGLLFVLLAANLEMKKFTLYGVELVFVVAAVMFLVRPLNIIFSTRKSVLTKREKAFLSWIAPRGIVAASMASIFALNLSKTEYPHADFLETFTYSVIAGTVIFQGFSAKMVGKMLGVVEPRPSGWIVVGAHRLGRAIARFIHEQDKGVILLDTNAREIRLAHREGLPALCDDAMTVDIEKQSLLYGCGNFVALTSNEDLNCLLCQRWSRPIGEGGLYRWEKEAFDENLDTRLAMGNSLWSDLELGNWLTHGEEDIPVKTIRLAEGESVPKNMAILMSSDGENIYPGPPPTDATSVTVLVIEESQQEQISQLPVEPEWVVFSEEEDLEGLYTRMLGLVAARAPQLDREALLKDLLAREEEFTSLLGHGISMPHSYSNKIENGMLLVARPKIPIPCQHTGSGIELVFMLLSPEDQPTEHLGHISHIARLIGKETGRTALLTAETPDALYEAVVQG